MPPTAGTVVCSIIKVRNGGRKNRRVEDSLFVLRTIIDKAIITGNKDLAIIFIDLAKAYDSVPHEFLWEKLSELGIHPQFIKIIQSVYGNSSTRILVNGHLTEPIKMKQGIMQGCILSPLLFTLYLSGLGHMLEKSPLGCKIYHVIISALLYVDDLILIGNNRENLITLLKQTQHYLEWLGMNINCKKSNIMTCTDIDDIPLKSSIKEKIGIIKKSHIYKYLGVQFNMGKTPEMFKDAFNTKVRNLESIMKKIIGLALNSFCPITVGIQLWKACAIPALLHGIEIISLTKAQYTKLEGTQGQFMAEILGVPHSTAHCGLRKEMGLETIQSLIYKRKITFAHRVANLNNETWVKQAYLENQIAQGKTPTNKLKDTHVNHTPPDFHQTYKEMGNRNIRTLIVEDGEIKKQDSDQIITIIKTTEPKMGGQWMSQWGKEIDLITEHILNITNIQTDSKMKPKEVTKTTRKFNLKKETQDMEQPKEHSLKWLPEYQITRKPQKYLYIGNEDLRSILTMFRLGNAGLGNRGENRINKCPSCKTMKISESHLIFECTNPEINKIKEHSSMKTILQTFLTQYNDPEPWVPGKDEMLRKFLQGDNKTLTQRAEYIQKIHTYYINNINTEDSNNINQVNMDHTYG